MDKVQQDQQALSNARNGASMINYATIFEGFMAKGIAESEIEPRVNVLTFKAWRALGRTVKRREHGIRVLTWIAIDEKRDDSGNVVRAGGRKPHTAHVFHVSQTEELQPRDHAGNRQDTYEGMHSVYAKEYRAGEVGFLPDFEECRDAR